MKQVFILLTIALACTATHAAYVDTAMIYSNCMYKPIKCVIIKPAAYKKEQKHFPSQSMAIMIDCGTDDFFCIVNRHLHQKMVELKIPHDYVERPGNHSWKYWGNAIEYQLLFFKKHFKNQ